MLIHPTTVPPGAAATGGIDNSSVLDDTARDAINRGNALTLFPKFADHPLLVNQRG